MKDAAPNRPTWRPPSREAQLAAELLQVVRPQIDPETAREAARAVLDIIEKRKVTDGRQGRP